MMYEVVPLNYALGTGLEAVVKEDVWLDVAELDRIAFFAEHPEFVEPLFLGIRQKRNERR